MSALIITDGSIAGFVACWLEGVARPDDAPRARDGAAVGGPAAWIDPRVTAAGEAAAMRSAGLCRLIAVTRGQAWAGLGDGGVGDTGILLSAGVEAIRRGVQRVVWPVCPGAGESSVSATAAAFDRALLAGRLLSVDLPTSRPPMRIETPMLDLSDAGLLDLAADLDAPLAAENGACWCIGERPTAGRSCGVCTECVRWEAALRETGLTWEDLGLAGVGGAAGKA